MKITRRQLRSIIIENVLSERVLNEGYDSMSSVLTGEHGLFGLNDSNSEAVLVHVKGTEYGKGKGAGPGKGNRPAKFIMDTVSSATARDLSKKDYYLWKGLDDFWENGAVGSLPASGRRGDPYLYMPSSVDNSGLVDKVRVVGGPVARAIGKEISASALQSKQRPNANPEGDWKDWAMAGLRKIKDFIMEKWEQLKETASTVKEAVVRAASDFWGWTTDKVASLVEASGISFA